MFKGFGFRVYLFLFIILISLFKNVVLLCHFSSFIFFLFLFSPFFFRFSGAQNLFLPSIASRFPIQALMCKIIFVGPSRGVVKPLCALFSFVVLLCFLFCFCLFFSFFLFLFAFFSNMSWDTWAGWRVCKSAKQRARRQREALNPNDLNPET